MRFFQSTKHRWLFIIILVFLVITLELLETITKSLVPDIIDLAAEVFFEGLLLPFSIVLLLNVVNRLYAEKNAAINRLSLLQDLESKLAACTTWPDLTKTICAFPFTFLPLLGVRLFIFNEKTQGFELESWSGFDNNPQQLLALNQAEIEISECEAGSSYDCLARGLYRCDPPANPSGVPFNRWCLPLSQSSQPVALLHLYTSPFVSIAVEHYDFIAQMAGQMALALLNARLSRQASRSTALLEAERQRISHDLHDILGQDLAFLARKLESLAGETISPDFPLVREELQRLHKVANEAYEVVRGTLVALRGSDTSEFFMTMEDYARELGVRSGFEVDFQCLGEQIPLSPSSRFQIFSIFREALANVERHASASQVNVRLLVAGDGLMLDIQDDGCGFDASHPVGANHYGLKIIEERTQQLNGSFLLKSTPQSGTRVSVRLPIDALLQPNGSPG